jgi:hypothetical protein
MNFLQENIQIILYVVAAITSVVTLQFFFPRFYAKKILQVNMPKGAPLFYFAHWGILVFALCVLMVYAAYTNVFIKPVVAVVLMEKALLAGWVFYDFKKAYTKKLIPAALFDTVVSIVFILYLLGY